MIPRILWTYWHCENEMPEFVKKCIKNWKQKNPMYDVHIITRKNMHKYVGFEESKKIKKWKFNDSIQRTSDLVRLSVLSKYGGIWMDASCVCNESLDWIHDEKSECIVYHIPEISDEIIPESWFIACNRNNEYIQKVNKEFRNVEKYNSIDEYISSNSHIKTQGIDFAIHYLLIYFVMKKVYYENENKNIKVLNASEGPYVYFSKGGLTSIIKMKEKPKFFKFRKNERSEMTDEIENCIFLKN